MYIHLSSLRAYIFERNYEAQMAACWRKGLHYAGMGEPKYIPRERKRDPAMLHTHSIVSARTKRGVVVIEWNNETGQFDPEDARVFAHTLLREADNAETDAFVFSEFQKFLEPEQLGVLITHFREERARREQAAGLRRKSEGNEIPEDDRR
jgi:hypothetical protein